MRWPAPWPRVLVVVLVGLLAAGLVHAQGIAVICHPSVDLSAAEVRDLYFGEIQFTGRIKLVPIDNLALQRVFLGTVLHVEPAKYSTLWAKRAFRDGLMPPAVKVSDAEVIAFVRSTPGAIGYVTAGNVVPRDVRVITSHH